MRTQTRGSRRRKSVPQSAEVRTERGSLTRIGLGDITIPFPAPTPQADWTRIALVTAEPADYELAQLLAETTCVALAAIEARHGAAYLQLDELLGEDASLLGKDRLALVLTGTRSLVELLRQRVVMTLPELAVSKPERPLNSLCTWVAIHESSAVVSDEGYFARSAPILAEMGWRTFLMNAPLFTAMYGSDAP